MRVNKASAGFLLFVIGMFCRTRVFFLGAFEISEFIVLPLGLLWFFQDYGELKRDGFMTFFKMGLLLAIGMFASAAYNHSPYTFLLKRSALVYSIFCYVVVFHRLLRGNFRGIGWFFIGVALSNIITIFAFNGQAHTSATGFSYEEKSIEDVMSGQLFWYTRLLAVGQLPVVMAYLKTPLAYPIVMPLFFVAFLLATTESGRSGALIVMGLALFALVGGKSRKRMQMIGRHVLLFCVGALFVVMAYKTAYSYAVKTGWVKGHAALKYEWQTERGSDLLSLLMAGRKETFMAILPIMDRPIIGHGVGTADTKGYTERFLMRFGTDRELLGYQIKTEYGARLWQIEAHSAVLAAWVRYGILGFVFYVYVFWLMYKQVRCYMGAIPQWFGMMALLLSHYAWHLVFDPCVDRYLFGFFIACLLLARAVGQGKLALPWEMELEARQYD